MEVTFTQQIPDQGLCKVLESNKQNGFTNKPKEEQNERQQYDSQFLEIDSQMMQKLQKIDKSKKAGIEQKQKQSKIHSILKVLSPLEQRQEEAAIKKDFVHKLKQWDRERQQLKVRKQEIEQKKLRQKEELSLKKQQEEEQEKEFLRLQKQKQLQQKIQQIEQRRQKREQSLKNALLKRSYNNLPSYAQADHKLHQEKEHQIEVSLKMLKQKRRQAHLSPQELKMHEKAYIQRIKQRLNMVPRREQKAKSDFNLYLRRSEQKRQENIAKILKMKNYQQKINAIPVRIDQHKKEEKLIEIDKINNPQKYRLLSQKLLNDQQIYEEFKNFSINIDRKELGINYLNQLKQAHKKLPIRKSNSQQLHQNPEQRLPNIVSKQELPQITTRHHEKSKSVEAPSEAYRQSLDKNKERDSRYMKALHQKLARAVDL